MPDMVSQLVFLLKSALDTRIGSADRFWGEVIPESTVWDAERDREECESSKERIPRDSLTNSIESTYLSH